MDDQAAAGGVRAPGLKYRKRKSGLPVPYWFASRAAIKAGYPVKLVRLGGHDARLLLSRCERLQSEMALWLQGQTGSSHRPFEGTIRSLIEIYQTDVDSPYRQLKPSSRHPYDIYARLLCEHIGDRRIDRVDRRDVSRWFAVWSAPVEPDGKPRLAAARMAITVLKTALTFGQGCRHAGCADLRLILNDMGFPGLRPRPYAPTVEDVVRVRAAARAAGEPRRALAYAIQFEATQRQWDVIGEWLPLNDPRPSSLIIGRKKWIGPTWARIDEHLILRLMPTKTEDSTAIRVTIDLNECPMVIEELATIPEIERRGPLIINARTGLPYRHEAFRSGWRKDATAAGIPRAVWNRDLRAGGVTEGGRAGASIEDRAKMAGHAKPKITAAVYDRDTLEAARRVARARTKLRSNDGGT